MKLFLCIFVTITMANCRVIYQKQVETETETEPPTPGLYAFGYAAGRSPGNIDRIHSEVSDGSGVVRGSYSYVDPKFQIRTVDYVADKNGFHPTLSNSPPPLPKDSPVVAAAKERHLKQYAAIANERQALPGEVLVPLDTLTVERAKARHLSLYEKIAEDHRRLAAEQEAKRLAEEAAQGDKILQEHVE